jgi:hypothetical protein
MIENRYLVTATVTLIVCAPYEDDAAKIVDERLSKIKDIDDYNVECLCMIPEDEP